MPPPLYHIPPTLQQPPRKKTLISLLIKNGEGLKFLFNSIIVLSTLFRRGELCSPAFYCRGFPSRYKLKIIPCTRTNKPNLKGPFSQRGLAPQVTGGSLRICFVSANEKHNGKSTAFKASPSGRGGTACRDGEGFYKRLSGDHRSPLRAV